MQTGDFDARTRTDEHCVIFKLPDYRDRSHNLVGLERESFCMTALDVVFRYGQHPSPATFRALQGVREVYGIRLIRFDPREQTIHVEYDASRLSEQTVAGLLRGAGLDLREKLQLA